MDLEECLRAARSRGCLDFALHKPANIAHGDSEIVLSLQIHPELRGGTDIARKSQCGIGADSALVIEDFDNASRRDSQRER